MADRHITSNGRIMYRAVRVEVIKYTIQWLTGEANRMLSYHRETALQGAL